ncbi:MAG: HD domain-containing protein [Solirubrobacteraceae bacterium]
MTPAIPELPDSDAVRLALQVAERYESSALRNHSVRSYLFAATEGRRARIDFDGELLAVAALLHDLGLIASFDSHTLPFEEAGGDVGWVFAAAAGWRAPRRDRVREIVVRHMREAVTPAEDPEGHLLQFSTSLDISGRGVEKIPRELLREVIERWPRLDLASEFAACFGDQASRKPDGAAARSVGGGIARRLADNPLEHL